MQRGLRSSSRSRALGHGHVGTSDATISTTDVASTTCNVSISNLLVGCASVRRSPQPEFENFGQKALPIPYYRLHPLTLWWAWFSSLRMANSATPIPRTHSDILAPVDVVMVRPITGISHPNTVNRIPASFMVVSLS